MIPNAFVSTLSVVVVVSLLTVSLTSADVLFDERGDAGENSPQGVDSQWQLYQETRLAIGSRATSPSSVLPSKKRTLLTREERE
jgi:hypothetical protein